MYICPAVVDGEYEDTDSEEDTVEDDQTLDDEIGPSQPMTISILEIARPTRLKGVAKDFEVVRRPQHVIALEDDSDGLDDLEDDWERIYAEEPRQTRTYSAVVHGQPFVR